MVFNILVTHANHQLHNHAFLYDTKAAGWRLSLLYDGVPKLQPAQERMLHLYCGAAWPIGTAGQRDGRCGRLWSATTGCRQNG